MKCIHCQQEIPECDDPVKLRAEIMSLTSKLETITLKNAGIATQLDMLAQECNLAANPFKWEHGTQLTRLAEELRGAKND